MITVNYNGRLGNQIIQYIAASIFAMKFNLHLDFNNGLDPLLIHKSGGIKNSFFPMVTISDENFLSVLKPKNHLHLFPGIEFNWTEEVDIMRLI